MVMRGPLVPVVAVALLLAAACGGDGGSTPSAADPTTPPTVSPTTEPVAPATTSEPTTVTTVEPSATEMAVLRPNGLGPVDFDTPAEQAIAELTELLGAPDRVEPIEPGGECVEGASWLDCIGERVVEHGQLAVWNSYGIEVALVDTARYDWSREQRSLQFGDWHATVTPGDARLVTEEGLSAGMTIGELRAVAPWVEFTYNEGLLDSFYASIREAGGYWGRLDWDPATSEIDWLDVAAMQTALNGHGAELDVDGVWGPASKAAWLAFLSDHGVDSPALAAEWPPWLTPDIGRALGLPPDDIVVATLEPRPAVQPAATDAPLAILRDDGLGRFDFGEPANELVDELTAMIGPPGEDTSYTPDGPGPFDHLPLGYWASHELRIVSWREFDLRLVLSDIGLVEGDWTPTPGTLTLVSWATASPRLSFSDGVGVGSLLSELQAQVQEIDDGTFDVCETEYDPASFSDTPPLWRGLRGTTDWDWISDLQQALNERGASLAVDGEYGPDTRAAVSALEQQIGIHHVDGLVDPMVTDSLSLDPPINARIVSLAAGYPGSC